MRIALLLFVWFILSEPASATEPAQKGKAEITVSYERQEGRGSNQYAVWIEDSGGNLVKTLYVTRFTAQGGYVPRPACTPKWVEKANPASLSQPQIDAFSGATPSTGDQTYIWDLTDSKGEKVKKGKYTFYVQGTLSGEQQVLFKGVFETGKKKAVIETTPEFSHENTNNKGMIKAVKAVYFPN